MHIQKIRAIAKKMDIIPGSLDKKSLIHAIQIREGNAPCFKTELTGCGQMDCCWRDDCKPPALAAQ